MRINSARALLLARQAKRRFKTWQALRDASRFEDGVFHVPPENEMTEPNNTVRTELPEVKWHPLAGQVWRTTPGGHRAHFDYEVKSWPWLFEPMMAKQKMHDMRDMRDRPYKIGDRMLLREFDPRTGTYTGREGVALITYITNNETPCAMSSSVLDRDFAVLSVICHELGDTDRNA